MAAELNPLQNHQQHSTTGYDERLIDRVKELFPVTATWPDEAIVENIRYFKEAAEHMRGYCCNIHPLDPRHTYKAPTERPGEFEVVQCPKAWETGVKEAIAEANLPKRFLRLKLSDLDGEEVRKLFDYVNGFEALKREGKGLLLAGKVGVGKTQKIVSLAIELINRYLTQVKFFTCQQFLDLHKAAMKDGFAKMKLEEDAYKCELAIIDDIGANRFSEYDQAAFGSFINERYNEMLPVILSTNLSKADLTELVGERVVSRITEMCERIVLDGPDRRTRRGE
ncbi:hypothetical protein GFC01_00770 [Desulfofundulus thermobenzoicus]|uniref:IstB-like ATP-binding domain-containing protein n=1 Tax=Desulfofundulus thermobenzoicus TaxID=29376 RepID=A0A6N7ILH5_9FIRM|nr:ATP-binding protein [Desulfofundulus thermobenzoicus]MQL50832.1 hypothetical protein [Desulfofundulus thermobenzoicus]